MWNECLFCFDVFDVCHNVVAASFFPALVSSIQFARDVEFSTFAEAERLV